MSKSRIFLVGMMGAGKSTIGPFLADKLGWEFVDMDMLIEKSTGFTIAQLFEKRGEAWFRQLEGEILDGILPQENVVVATGGGTICVEGNLLKMQQSGYTVYLKAQTDTLLKRLEKNIAERPLLVKDDDLRDRLEDLLAARKTSYEQANLHMETDHTSIGEVVEKIIEGFDS